MKNPSKDEKIGLIINLEMQIRADSSYPLMQRAIHNIARMITGQKKVVFENDDYGKIAKVYSIWILPSPGIKKQNSIAYYSMQEELMEGEGKEEKSTYDLCGIYLLRLGDNSKRKVLQVLNLIFKTIMEREEKIRILEEAFDVHLSDEAKKEVNDNMMLGEWFREDGLKAGLEQGIQQGLAQGIQQGKIQGTNDEMIESVTSLMDSMKISLEEAMSLLQYSEEKKKLCRELLSMKA